MAVDNEVDLDQEDRDITYALGQMVVTAGRLEGAVWGAARLLNVEPEGAQFEQVQKAIRRAMIWFGLPPWAETTEPDIDRWLTEVDAAFKHRHQFIHSSLIRGVHEGRWYPMLVPSRGGAPTVWLTVDALHQLNAKLNDLLVRGEGPDTVVAGMRKRLVDSGAQVPSVLDAVEMVLLANSGKEGAVEHYSGEPVTVRELMAQPGRPRRR